jgi:GNAT superfamily N-acetyltransferase
MRVVPLAQAPHHVHQVATWSLAEWPAENAAFGLDSVEEIIEDFQESGYLRACADDPATTEEDEDNKEEESTTTTDLTDGTSYSTSSTTAATAATSSSTSTSASASARASASATTTRIPTTFVAVSDDGVALGTVTVDDADMCEPCPLGPWVAAVYVRPESRRAGVATALVLHALRFVAPLQVRDEREKRGEQRERAREGERSRDTDREGHKQRERDRDTKGGSVVCGGKVPVLQSIQI